MGSSVKVKIALLGNPNIGKTTLFNKLCGLKQKTGNYPGVTVDKKKGYFSNSKEDFELIDLPGINSLYPNSKDEELVLDFLLNPNSDDFPDKIVVLVSAINLKRNLYLFDQIRDLNIPMVLVVNMVDLAKKRGISIDVDKLGDEFGVKVIGISAKTSSGIEELKEELSNPHFVQDRLPQFIEAKNSDLVHQFSKIIHLDNEYVSFLKLTQEIKDTDEKTELRNRFISENEINTRKWKTNESILRYKIINEVIKKTLVVDKAQANDLTTRLDKILLHRFWGYVIFMAVMFTIFQSIFIIASYPMDMIDSSFSALSSYLNGALSEGYFTDLITDGIIPGVGGVIIFVPQIAILFLLFSILEESGYMPRIVYLMDRIMQRFGMSGKSIVPLISGLACAVPAIMSARTIENKRERLITILVTPLLTCSARIPVYVIVISLVIPDSYYGPFNLQGMALMGLYLLGVVTALIAAWVFKKIIKSEFKSYLVMEMPEYLKPGLKNVLISMWSNSKAFIWNAGRFILATSVILFVLATNGGEDFKSAEAFVVENSGALEDDVKETKIAERQLETSYLGVMGKVIEPAIKPLGYD